MKLLIVFLVGFARDFLATWQLRAIARKRIAQATFLAGVTDLLWFALTYLIAHSTNVWFAIPCMLGNILATNFAMRLSDGTEDAREGSEVPHLRLHPLSGIRPPTRGRKEVRTHPMVSWEEGPK